jgi:hypothetical protein
MLKPCKESFVTLLESGSDVVFNPGFCVSDYLCLLSLPRLAVLPFHPVCTTRQTHVARAVVVLKLFQAQTTYSADRATRKEPRPRVHRWAAYR